MDAAKSSHQERKFETAHRQSQNSDDIRRTPAGAVDYYYGVGRRRSRHEVNDILRRAYNRVRSALQ
jgi:hypothetical protein